MQNRRLTLIAVATFFLVAHLDAGEISIYRDQDGVITLTDRPVPAGTRVEKVVPYKEKSPAEPQQPGKMGGGSLSTPETMEARRIRDLQERAKLLRKEAETESALAREKIKVAEEYLEEYRQMNRNKRRRYQKEVQRITGEAEEAQTRANAAIEKANQAMEAAQKALDARAAKPR
jgi:hypothetical protein